MGKSKPIKIATQRVNTNGKKTLVLSKGIEVFLDGEKLEIPFNTAYFFDIDIEQVTNEKLESISRTKTFNEILWLI